MAMTEEEISKRIEELKREELREKAKKMIDERTSKIEHIGGAVFVLVFFCLAPLSICLAWHLLPSVHELLRYLTIGICLLFWFLIFRFIVPYMQYKAERNFIDKIKVQYQNDKDFYHAICWVENKYFNQECDE